MDEKFLKLTNTVYRLLEFFPESDPLKHRAKDRALSIMEHLILVNENNGWATFGKEKIKVHILEDIDVLLGYLWIAKSQGWLNSVNCLIVANEYEKIKKTCLPAGRELAPIPAPESVLLADKIPDRQEQIIEFLKNNEKAQVVDLQTIFPDITKRTIRRDLDELLDSGKIVRMGDFNEIFYKIK